MEGAILRLLDTLSAWKARRPLWSVCFFEVLVSGRPGKMGRTDRRKAMNSNAPNLFHYVTKELSQDAMIC